MSALTKIKECKASTAKLHGSKPPVLYRVEDVGFDSSAQVRLTKYVRYMYRGNRFYWRPAEVTASDKKRGFHFSNIVLTLDTDNEWTKLPLGVATTPKAALNSYIHYEAGNRDESKEFINDPEFVKAYDQDSVDFERWCYNRSRTCIKHAKKFLADLGVNKPK